MNELYMQYKKNNHLYELETYNDLVKITRNKKIIHLQFQYMTSHSDLEEKGFKNLNDIVGDFSSYIDFCEENQYYNRISFDDDEWSKHTKIYAKIIYKDGGNKYFGLKRQVDSIQGSMANSRTNKVITEYCTFSTQPKKNKIETPIEEKTWTAEQVRDYLNQENSVTMYK
mgnify:CR=1 FL=1